MSSILRKSANGSRATRSGLLLHQLYRRPSACSLVRQQINARRPIGRSDGDFPAAGWHVCRMHQPADGAGNSDGDSPPRASLPTKERATRAQPSWQSTGCRNAIQSSALCHCHLAPSYIPPAKDLSGSCPNPPPPPSSSTAPTSPKTSPTKVHRRAAHP